MAQGSTEGGRDVGWINGEGNGDLGFKLLIFYVLQIKT